MSYENFELALKFLFPSEGGYVNHKDDKGGPTNMGVTQTTYDSYRKKHNLPPKNVTGITRNEAKQIYYEDYWLVSGADKVEDPKMSIVMFDTAVLHGPYSAKKYYNDSEGNIDKYLNLRKNFYDQKIINEPNQSVFYDGWVNRVNNLKNYVDKLEQTEDFYQPSDYIIESGIKTSRLEQVINNILKKFYEYKNKNIYSTGYAADMNEAQKSSNTDYESEYYRKTGKHSPIRMQSDGVYGEKCSGSYPVSGYTRGDNTKVSSYVRKCHKHGGSLPKLNNLSKEEIDYWVAKFI